MSSFRRIFVAISLTCLLGCSSQRVVEPSGKSDWSSYTRCEHTAGYYKNINDFEVIGYVSTGSNYQTFSWLFIGQKKLNIEFLDKDPKIQVRTLPTGKVTEFPLSFVVEQDILPMHPIHKVPKDMTTKMDYDRSVILYGKVVRPLLGPERFEAAGEIKSPPYLNRTEKPPKINGEPNEGYQRIKLFAEISLLQLPFDELEIQLPLFRLNGSDVEASSFHFKWGKKMSGFRSDMCNTTRSHLPPGLRNGKTEEKLF